MFKHLLAFFVLALQGLLALGYTNPVKEPNGSDPFMVYDKGYYYLTTTTWTNIQITRATTIAGLKTATPKVVWTDSTTSRCCNVWAPEIHWQPNENAWFIYYTAGTSNTLDNQRLHALRGSSSDIWGSSWSFAGRIVIPNRDVWAIDGTILTVNSKKYLVYSSWDGSNQCLWISQMTSATTVGNTVKISTPTYSWERIGANVNEGPAALQHNGRTWIVFSGSSCTGTGYVLGRLELASGADPLNASSWTKYGSPIFTSANGDYQPGHNGFFSSPSGNTLIVFHANHNTPGSCDGSRYTMVQPVNWNGDGTPNLGSPLPLSQNIAEPV